MALSSITLNNFRCFNLLKVDLIDGANFFYGKNGSGKTTILEAIYLACSGRSFKSSNIESAITLEHQSFHIKAFDNEPGFIIEAYNERKNYYKDLTNTNTVGDSAILFKKIINE